MEDLHGDALPRAALLRCVHRSHAASSEERSQRVPASERLADQAPRSLPTGSPIGNDRMFRFRNRRGRVCTHRDARVRKPAAPCRVPAYASRGPRLPGSSGSPRRGRARIPSCRARSAGTVRCGRRASRARSQLVAALRRVRSAGEPGREGCGATSTSRGRSRRWPRTPRSRRTWTRWSSRRCGRGPRRTWRVPSRRSPSTRAGCGATCRPGSARAPSATAGITTRRA